jgi:hypothetical protein
MSPDKQSLAKAVGGLKQALAGDGSGSGATWVRRVDQALDAIEQAVRQHRAILSDAQGRVVDVDSSLNPSPGVARRADGLRQELDGLLNQAATLRGKLKSIHPPAKPADPSTAAGALPVAPEVGDITDFGVFCERAEQLLEGFGHYDEQEAQLIEDSVTLDLGAGD